jgi:hypothetical protein
MGELTLAVKECMIPMSMLLVHEFVDSIANERDNCPNAVQSANWTWVGLLPHESAMEGEVIKRLNDFTVSATQKNSAIQI